jgi:uncharacterized protein (UPF0147 family)
MSARGKSDHLLLSALVCGATVEIAARKAGVSERTAYRRLADPTFREQLRQSRADVVQRLVAMSTAASGEGYKTLVALMQDHSVPAAVRRKAASDSIAHNAKLREGMYEDRLRALEEQFFRQEGTLDDSD